MKTYKGYNKDLKCNPNGKEFQYIIDGRYEEKEARCCENGFHSAETHLMYGITTHQQMEIGLRKLKLLVTLIKKMMEIRKYRPQKLK